ncbi:hypothetical protein SCP_0510500 [Sparassis crispa]|uniref:Uncharacterized protein n=1 Tax=Sparassis crispa TaxID=139825 RepID=A0A401GP21_9APHY|nr:hypothetical protein SCP_0510500 [Sparassis crispa]GBE83991.1 hypothetical protein SCP_0510500 [Sparassis crispa]
MGECHTWLPEPRSRPYEVNGLYPKSTEEHEVDEDADVCKSAYELKDTTEEGGSDAESLLMRHLLLRPIGPPP